MKEDGSCDYNNLKGALEEIISANPEAKILVRIRFYPPTWWQQKYPDDVIMNEKGMRFHFPCVSSQRFRDDSVKVLETIIDFCEKNYGKNIIGYHPGGGNSCEWFYGNATSALHYGFNKTAVDAWKKWVAKKYNIPMSEVMTIGDSLNDMDLITCGAHGVCVGDGLPELKEKANEVTVPFKEKPVEYLLKKYCL